MTNSNKVKIEIPGTFTDQELNKISEARLNRVKMTDEAEHVAQAGAQIYVSLRTNLDRVEKSLGLPLTFEVTPEVFKEVCTLAGRVNL